MKELPYMTHDELHHFIAVNPELSLSPPEVEYLHLRRRRLSIELRGDPRLRTSSDAVRCVVVGDDSVQAKFDSALLFALGTVPEGVGDQVPVLRRALDVPLEGCGRQVEVEVLTPQCTPEHRLLRSMLYSTADAVIIFFSVRDRDTFEQVREGWVKEAVDAAPASLPPAMVLVGADAGGDAEVSSQEAVALAEELGVAKYVEIYSGNLAHAEEVFKQGLEAVGSQLAHASPQQVSDRQSRQRVESVLFLDKMRSSKPLAKLDPFDRALVVEDNGEGVVVSDPPGLQGGRLQLTRPYPEAVVLHKWERCKLPSQPLQVDIPPEAPVPEGGFDPLRRGFSVVRVPGVRYLYTTDQTDPGLTSPELPPDLIFHPGDALPKELRVIGVGVGCDWLRSRPARFALPPALPTPRLERGSDGGVRVVNPQAMVDYKYTVDGTAPAASSPVLEGVFLPRPGHCRLRVAAFP
eukprot:Hpha_TRINITY_DN18734_c0_g1::TRINITY_DN18734_c0_g1_i1::g.47500::m.47500